ncbi:hypothetical protein Ngar_c18230 [Candidatus Nitrososphaera gargensis Ga9.2]|uniref:Uncharacterized protein n=1 Tax=Nitrososphaera gargensis (strain Ga9.2) TaxID=1237085 RepID=K0IBU9_NITGG|nr:hypothetical protein Ngar_c18230 [Candidatus Nitrososphaera gargensis Ga9.2]
MGMILLEIATERMVIDKDDECCIQLLAEAVNNRAKIRKAYNSFVTSTLTCLPWIFTIFQLSLEKL